MKQNVALGMGFMLLSTAGFAAMHASIRHLSGELHPFEIAFFRNLFGFFALVPFFYRFGLAPLRTRRFPLYCLRAGVNIFAMLSFFLALSMTPLARVQALGFTAPLFAALLAIFLLGERARLRRWAALAAGFCGALLIVRPGLQALDTGSVLALVSALFWGVALILIKRLSATDSSVTITVYMVLLMTPLSLPPALLYWRWPDAGQLVWLLGLGVAGTLGQMAMAQAFRLADATAVMPLDFLKLIWGALLGFFFFAEVPDTWTLAGGTLIFVSATYVAYRERQAQTQPAPGADSEPAGEGDQGRNRQGDRQGVGTQGLTQQHGGGAQGDERL